MQKNKNALTKRAAIKTVKEFVSSLSDAGIEIEKAILFGSYAAGRQKEWSDIDLALVSRKFSGIRFRDSQLFSRLLIHYPFYFIQAQTYPPGYFQKGDPFIDEIKRTGIEIKLDRDSK